MVFYFTCSDPKYTIYMGRDKYENEHLIAHGWPEDLWFHVDNHSSAHVYLRLPKGESIDDVPEEMVQECSQLTKANSIEGCKLSHVPIIYTMWSNLRKADGMADGQVGYHNRRAVKHTVVEHRINAIVNRLQKTRVEKHNNPAELAALRRERDEEEEAERKSASVAANKQKAIDEHEARMKEATKVETLYGMQNVDEDAQAKLLAEQEAAIAATLKARAASGKKKKGSYESRGAGVSDASLVDDLFGGIAVSDKPAAKAGGGGGGGGGGGAADDDGGDGGDLWGGVDDDWGMVDIGDDDGSDDDDGGGEGGGSLYGSGGGGGGKRFGDASLGALGAEAAAVAANAKSEKEMEQLAALAHERKAAAAEAAKKAAAAKAAKAEEERAALEAKRQALHGKRAEVTAEAVRGRTEAAAALAALGDTSEAAELNRAAQEEELMVLEAIYGEEALAKEEGEPTTAFALCVEGETAAGKPASVRLRVSFVPEYPSHLPPGVELLEGAAADDAPFVADSLHARFFAQRREAGDDCELSECVVVHAWAEWLRDEWMANQA
jgi:hypothetical protein